MEVEGRKNNLLIFPENSEKFVINFHVGKDWWIILFSEATFQSDFHQQVLMPMK